MTHSTASLRHQISTRFAAGPVDCDEIFESTGIGPDSPTGDLLYDLIDEVDPLELLDGRLVSATWLANGVRARHRVSTEEIEARSLELDNFLPVILGSPAGDSVLWRDVELHMEESTDTPGHFVLCPPDDFWTMVTAHGITEMRRDGKRVVLEVIDDPTDAWSPTATRELAEWLGELGREHGRPMLFASADQSNAETDHSDDEVHDLGNWIIGDETVVIELLAAHQGAMSGAAPPLSDIVAAAGCRWKSPWIAGPEVTEANFALYALGRGLIDRFGRGKADDDAAEMVGTAVLTYGHWRDMIATGNAAGADTSIGDLLDMSVLLLGESPVIARVLGDYPGAPDHPFAQFVMASVERCRELAQPLRPGLNWLAARLLIAERKPVEALDMLREAEVMFDPDDWHEAIEDFAQLLVVQGDLRGAIQRFDLIGEPQVSARLRAFAPTTPKGIGRNERCPCGSGRKFKQCCANRDTPDSLEDRVGLLWWKAQSYCHSHHVACLALPDHHTLSTFDPQFMGDLFTLAADAHLVEDFAFEEFIEEFGGLLPEDEQRLAATWSICERSLHEIVEVDPGATLTLRDLRTGERAVVRERTGSRSLEVGHLLLARAVPSGATLDQIVGVPINVPFSARDQCLALLDSEPNSNDIMDFVIAMFAGPKMTNTDGDPLVLREVVWQVDSHEAAVRALDEALGRSEQEERWSRTSEGQGRSWIRWTLALSGTELTGSTNSDERWIELEEFVRATVPGATLLDESVTPLGEALTDRELFEGPRPGSTGSLGQEDLDPEIAKILRQMLQDGEEGWCDESIPALHGATPREAAADPTRREDLIALIRSMIDRDERSPIIGLGGYDPYRLAELLDLHEIARPASR